MKKRFRWAGRWAGASAVCLASGPSLTAEDVALVRKWQGPERYVLVANTTFQSAPWADVLYANDYRWWKHYLGDVRSSFTGERVTCCGVPGSWGVELLDRKEFDPLGNSGAAIIALAIAAGCTRILMLGYDCSLGPNGESHHHGDHPEGWTNCLSIRRWPRAFERLAYRASMHRAEVVNCSRRTALECFPRADLEEALTDYDHWS